jgi:hypothetical protein
MPSNTRPSRAKRAWIQRVPEAELRTIIRFQRESLSAELRSESYIAELEAELKRRKKGVHE